MDTFMFLFSFSLFTLNVKAFLLDDKTTSPNSGVAGHQYIALMELLTDEMKARKRLEEAVTQLHTEVVSKTLNITNHRGQTDMIIAELQTKLQNIENNLQQSVQQQKMENAALHQSYSSLQKENSIIKQNNYIIQQQYSMLQQNYSTLQVEHDEFKNKLTAHDKKSAEIATEIAALKQLKAINQLHDINTLQTDTQALKNQVHTLTTNQAARGQDVLALYNQTLAFRSDMARDLTKLSRDHNDSMDLILRNLQNESKSSHQLISNINKTMHVFNQQIANNVTQSNSQIKKMFHDEMHVISRQIEDESNGWYIQKTFHEYVHLGYTGGGSYGDNGAAPESVCLPLDPDFNKTSGGDYGRIHGAEYNTDFFAANSNQQDLPCAVCRVRQASSVIMIPGKNRCYTGWKVEYFGYLSATLHSNKGATSYICIDIQPEYVTGGASWYGDGKRFYEVVAKCGSLHCPPYHNGYPMTCVVCSK
ncbi:Hypothetical predicted protein [Mytilus galloprovincialis]|uniref:Uncharacterized protein n=1 Tax=Mytilus galloprovincialis TaxID=29158 RepID=A0A8B6CZP8_MYTGA|nr:Hypothetical predicted protein [Mytilus galloprovincialis]